MRLSDILFSLSHFLARKGWERLADAAADAAVVFAPKLAAEDLLRLARELDAELMAEAAEAVDGQPAWYVIAQRLNALGDDEFKSSWLYDQLDE